MIEFYIDILKMLIEQGSLTPNDPIVAEVKEKLIDQISEDIGSQYKTEIGMMVDKRFDEEFKS